MLPTLSASTATLARSCASNTGRTARALAVNTSSIHRRHASNRTLSKTSSTAASRARSADEEAKRLDKTSDFFSSTHTSQSSAKFTNAPATTATPTTGSGSANVGAVGSALARNRKLTPTKAKAQASASRALREQLQAAKAASEPSVSASAASSSPPPTALDSDTASASQVPNGAATNITPALSVDATGSTLASAAIPTGNVPPSIAAQPLRLIRDVYAWATAEAYNFDILIASQRLPPNWQLIQDGEVIYVPHWPVPVKASQSTSPSTYTPGIGEAFIFRSGSYVTWGMSLEQSRKFLRSVIRGRQKQVPSAEIEGYVHVGDEAMEYIIAEDQITRVVGDVIVIGQQPRAEEELEGNYVDASAVSGEPEEPDWTPLLARVAFSQGLCRSARLSVQEEELSAYLEEVADMPARLEAEGKVPLPRRQVIRKMGTLLKLRQRANLDSENFLDDPEMYWENGELEHHYDSICQALDIETRFKAYNEKLDHGENLLGVLRALLTEASTHRMELIIIYLIAFEVCLALISHDYIPSPERVWNAVADFIGGDRYATASSTAATYSPATPSTISHAATTVPLEPDSANGVTHTQQQSYWRWLLERIPGLHRGSTGAAAPAASTGHVV